MLVDQKKVVSDFIALYHGAHERTWQNTFFMGAKVLKCPFDLWIYQEVIHEVRPDVIIEGGTYFGGSALYLASLCDLVGNGKVVTIDVGEFSGRPAHPRVEYLTGSTLSVEVLRKVLERIEGKRVMVILDDNHDRDHVLEELRVYGPMVTPGSYMIVEDGIVNHAVHQGTPGPQEAVMAFMKEDKSFDIDLKREKFFMTYNPNGYLRKKT